MTGVVCELLAQRDLGDLAGRRMRKFIDECHIVGNPPIRHLALEPGNKFLFIGAAPVFRHDDK